jgi:hypothetical protein
VEIPILFPTGRTLVIKFFVTSLDSSCSAVLGYNWLRQYNLMIDWSTGHIKFCSTEYRGPAPLPDPSEPTLKPPHQKPVIDLIPETPSVPITPPYISLISTPAYLCAAHLPGFVVFQPSLRDLTYGKAVQYNTTSPVDLSSIPEEYHKFANVFSKKKADTLPPHWSYDLKIKIEEGASPPPAHMYSLSPWN